MQYGGERAGREKLAAPEEVIPLIHQEIAPWLIDRALEDFRALMIELEEDLNPPRAVKYGVSQALLDAIAKERRVTMAELLAEEYGTTIENRDLVFFAQCGDEYYTTVDKMILRRVPVLPHALINSIPRFHQLLKYVTWTTQRIRDLVPDPDYHPILHFDLYGTLGLVLDNDIERMIAYLHQLEEAATPFQLFVEDPVHLSTQVEHIAAMSQLRKQIAQESLAIKLVADEWAPTLQDKMAFIKAGAADIYQIKTPDLGSIAKSVEAVLYCKAQGLGTYLGGSSAETARSAQVTVHIGLATQPDQVLAKPGMGVDEGISLMYNEMRRALALIFAR